MYSIQQAKIKAKEDQILSIPAKRILEKTKDIPSDVNKLKRRWFWELLQNASDYNEDVNIRLDLYNNKIIFSHDGKPFKATDARNLIAPDSGKDEDDCENKTIGQFGTGFISTHVLSGIISVKGIINENNAFEKFAFQLDRSGYNDKEYLKKSISESTKQYEREGEQIANHNRGFDSYFEYNIDSPLEGIDAHEVVKSGLEYVYEILPYTLGFIKKIKSVSIQNHGTNFISEKKIKFKPIFVDKDEFIIKVEKHSKELDITSEEKKFITSTEGETTVVVEIKEEKIVPYPHNITKLFCSLPMIGTENFPLPIVTNSTAFKPKTERDGIRVTGVETKNRRQIENALKAYKALFPKLINRNIKEGYHNILNWGSISFEDSTEKNWFKNNIVEPLKAFLLEQKIVKNSLGEMIKLNELKVPYFLKTDSNKKYLSPLNNLVSEYYPDVTVSENNHIKWYDSIDFKEFVSLKFELNDLLTVVDKKGSLIALKTRLSNSSNWLKRLHKLILDFDDKLLDQYKVIPNQLNKLVLRKDNINWDNEVDNDLIEIHNILNQKDFRELLVHKEFEELYDLIPQHKTLNSQKAAKTIDDLFSEVPENERSNVHFQKALRAIFSWFSNATNIGVSESQLKDWFKWFSKKKPQLFLETFDDSKRDKIFAIAQSEKYYSLSELAESDISKEDLNIISSNAKAVLKLSKTIETVPGGIDKLIKYAELIQKDQEDFEFKKAIGTKVEETLNDALISSGFNQGIFATNHDGFGAHDFEVKNNTNGKKFYIELKSYHDSSVNELHMAPSQAKFGKDRNENYSLSIIQRPQKIEDVTREYLKNNLKSRIKIENLVSEGVTDYDQFDSISRGDKLHLTLRDAVRIKVKKAEILNQALSFDELINQIKIYLS